MTTKFDIGIVSRKAQVSAKYNCPTSTVTLFSEYRGTRIHSSPVIQSQRRPANSGGTIVYNYPCYVRRRGLMPKGLLLFQCSGGTNNCQIEVPPLILWRKHNFPGQIEKSHGLPGMMEHRTTQTDL